MEKGKVRLDDPVQKYLPEFHLADEAVAQRITVRHLLTHTAGLGYRAQEVVYWKEGKKAQTLQELLVRLHSFQPLNEPGSQFDYSNVGYALLGAIIERVSGKAYPTYMREHVLQPLGMSQTAITPREYGNAPQAQQYVLEFGRLKAIPRYYEEWGGPAGLGWATNPADWSKYVKAQLGVGSVKLLSKATLEESHSSGIDTPYGASYSAGWFSKTIKGTKVIFHSGGGSSLIALIPDKNIGIVFMGNVLSTEVWNIGYEVAGMLIQEKGSAIAAYPPIFEIMSSIWAGMTVASTLLFALLLLSIANHLRGKVVAHSVLLVRLVSCFVLELITLAYVFFMNRDITETPNFFGELWGFYVDQLVGVVSFTGIVSVWAIYSLYLYMKSRKNVAAAQFRLLR